MIEKCPPSNWLPVLLLILAVALTFSNSLQGEFFELDDVESIRDNPHIRRLWPLSEPLCLSLWNTGATVDTRPVLALSFALNYKLTGSAPWGFHLGNLLIHLASALLMFGILRRTLQSMSYARPTALATVAAMVWAVHPLQTEAVTYAVQRATSLMGMCYLLTLYCAIRAFTGSEALKVKGSRFKVGDPGGAGVTGNASAQTQQPNNLTTSPSALRPPSSGLWPLAAVAACALGMATKESMVTAPVLVMLYDYVFSGKTPRALWQKRKGLYLGLMATWIIMIALVASTFEGMSRDASSMGMVRYAASQPLVILKYLKLAFWPRGLVLDYSNRISTSWQEILLPAIPLAVLFVWSVIGVVRRRPLGFLGCSFFVLLAPSSSFVPTLNVYNEHHMYLALAAVVMAVLVGIDRIIRDMIRSNKTSGVVESVLSIAMIVPLAVGTFIRNRDWHDSMVFWTDNVEKRPGSSTAHNNLGNVLLERGRIKEAMDHFYMALRIQPGYAEAYNNLGNALMALGRFEDAMAHYREALRLEPDHAEVYYNLGRVLEAFGRFEDAMVKYEQAVKLKQGLVEAHYNLGNVFMKLGHPEKAIACYQHALQIKPSHAKAHNNLGSAYRATGQLVKAIAEYQQALQIKPDFKLARDNLRETRKLIAERGVEGGK